MSKTVTQKSRAERILERSNKPILILAGIAVALYILELFRVVPQSWMTPFIWINFLIDFIFLIDLSAKCIILRRGYLKSPWFFIDFISTLPIISSSLELMGNVGPQLQATRVARGARVARIARVARVARLAKVARVARLANAIRQAQGLSFLKSTNESRETPHFNKALLIGVALLLTAFILASMYITNSEVGKMSNELEQRISQVQSQAEIEAIKEQYSIINAKDPTAEILTILSPLNGNEELDLSLSEAYVRADRITGVLLLLALLTIAISVYISTALGKDRLMGRERNILSQCFSPPIVSKFYSSPEIIERFFNQWMTIFFIDIRGFTKAFEKDKDDVEGLALKLRRIMDTARDEIVVTHEGVIDKFMGDAVMGWVGGHFSTHWDLLSEVREKLCLNKLDLIGQDIKSIQREIQKIDDQSYNTNGGKTKEDLKSTLEAALEDKSKLIAQQKSALEVDNTLQHQHQNLTKEYRRRVARSAVSCCLKISLEMEKIKDPDGFYGLKIGVGSGQVLVGNFGSTEQVGFTVLGPTVNRSARLEPASAQVGCNILIDKNTYNLLKDNEDFRFRRVPRIVVKGISHELVSFEPFLNEQVSESFLEQFECGVDALESGNTQEAIDYFTQANKLRPGGDAASKLWIEECAKALKDGESVGVKSVKK